MSPSPVRRPVFRKWLPWHDVALMVMTADGVADAEIAARMDRSRAGVKSRRRKLANGAGGITPGVPLGRRERPRSMARASAELARRVIAAQARVLKHARYGR